jgi:hypothetical protein
MLKSGPAYADLSVVENDINIEVPVRNECFLENAVEIKRNCGGQAQGSKTSSFIFVGDGGDRTRKSGIIKSSRRASGLTLPV